MRNSIEMGDRYTQALEEALIYLHERFHPSATVVRGSIVRGTAHPTSDLDIVVVHAAPWRQRVRRQFNGVPAEIFANPAFQIERQMRIDSREGRPVMAHMLVSGVLVHDTDGIGEALQSTAAKNLAAGPQVDPALLLLRQYGIATMFEDAVDLEAVDPERSTLLALQSLSDAIDWWFIAQGRWSPRSKDQLQQLEKVNQNLSTKVWLAISPSSAISKAKLVAAPLQEMLGSTGFFEWESAPESLADSR